MRLISVLSAVSVIASGASATTPRRPVHPVARATPKPVAAPPHVIPASGDLGRADLIAIGKLASVETDQFSDDPALKYVGRQFVVTVPASALSTDYNKDTHTLKISTPSYGDGYELQRDETSSEYVGQNGFGAKTTVTKTRGYAYGIEYPGERYQKKVFDYTATAEGPEARDLSKSIALRLTGTITLADGIWAKKGSIFFEHHEISDATVSSPYDNFVRRYFIANKIAKAEWVDTRTGAVLKTDTF